jgi:hypothetical protein
MKRQAFIAPIIFWTGIAYGWNEQVFKVLPGNIKDFRLHATSHIVAPARNIQQFAIDGLAGGCTHVFVDGSKDATLFAALWTAYIKRKPFQLAYDPDQHSPWGDPNTCAITSITFDPIP